MALKWDDKLGCNPIFIPFKGGYGRVMKTNIPKGGNIRYFYPTTIINNYLILFEKIKAFRDGGCFGDLRVLKCIYLSVERFFSKKGFFKEV